MPYTNTLTGSFGHSIFDVRSSHPEASIPHGAEYGDWLWYEPMPHAADGRMTVAVELPPKAVNGRLTQQWTLQPAPMDRQMAQFEDALDQHLDSVARQRRYDSRVTCALRAGYPGPFQAEGKAFALWMDNCNALAYSLMAEVMAGTRPMPASPQALIDLLPPMVWPA